MKDIKGFLDAGISVAAINYRYSTQAIFPAPFRDCARAIQYLRLRAKDWNINPEKIGATGGSAGAGISLWLAFHDDLADRQNADPVLRQSSRIQCVFGRVAQCSYDPRWIKEHVGGLAYQNGALQQLFGLKVKPEEVLTATQAFSMYKESSPINHLTKDDKAAVCLCNGGDEPNNTQPGAGIHSRKFREALKAAMDKLGLTCELVNERDSTQLEFFKKALEMVPSATRAAAPPAKEQSAPKTATDPIAKGQRVFTSVTACTSGLPTC